VFVPPEGLGAFNWEDKLANPPTLGSIVVSIVAKHAIFYLTPKFIYRDKTLK